MEKTVVKKKLQGVVVSDKMDKTIVIKVEVKKKHKLYHKILIRSKKVKVHDEKNSCNMNDRVQVVECRPISKGKFWRLDKVLERAK